MVEQHLGEEDGKGAQVKDGALKAILDCGARYRREMLVPYWVPDELTANWSRAFDFFLGRACYQGRSDNVSEKVDLATRTVLAASLYKSPDWSDPDFREFRVLLEERVGAGAGKPGKGRDVEMVVSALRFARALPDHNLVAHSLARIDAGELGAHYVELQAARTLNGIIQVGPKIAAFYLRDLVSLYERDARIAPAEFALLQPVDVWVRRLVARLALAEEKAPEDVIRAAIVGVCSQDGCSPLLFNQGLWYLGNSRLRPAARAPWSACCRRLASRSGALFVAALP